MHGQDGSPLETFGAEVGVCKKTVYNWRDAHPEFDQACEISRSMALKWWFEKGRDNLIMHEGEKFNASVWIFTMKAMFQMRDGSESKASEENPIGKTKDQLEAYKKEIDQLREALEVRNLRLVK